MSCVYFIQAGENGPIKIGLSTNVPKRFDSLQCSSATTLKLLAEMSGTRRDERQLHERFAMHRMHGEWFQPHADLLSFIATFPASNPRPKRDREWERESTRIEAWLTSLSAEEREETNTRALHYLTENALTPGPDQEAHKDLLAAVQAGHAAQDPSVAITTLQQRRALTQMHGGG